MSANLLVFVALKGAPGRDEPASGDGRLVVGTRCMEDAERCRVGATRECEAHGYAAKQVIRGEAQAN
jgi:hypothetical protein